MEPFYRKILLKSWKLSWKNKWLWVLGFFATFLGGGTFYETVVRAFTNMSDGRSIFYTLREYSNSGLLSLFSWTKIVELWSIDSAALILSLFTMLILFIIALIFIILAIISQAGIVKSAILLDENKKVTLKQSILCGITKFWSVLGVNFLMKVIMFGLILLIAFGASYLVLDYNWFNNLVYTIALVGLLVLSIIIYFLTIYAIAFIALRDKKLFQAIKQAWYIFKDHVILNIEMGLILFIVNILVGVVVVISSFLVLSPFILIYLIMLFMGLNAGLNVLAVVIFLLFGIIIALMGSWFTVFQITTWSILFEELAVKKGKSKLLRIFERIKNRKKR